MRLILDVACFLLRDVRSEGPSQWNDIIRDDPNRFFEYFATKKIFKILTGFLLYEVVREKRRERERV